MQTNRTRSGNQGVVTVTASAQEVSLDAVKRRLRYHIIIHNDSGTTIYVGFTDSVTTTTGYPVLTGTTWVVDSHVGSIYALTASGTADVRVFELYE